jgi:AcrR family transcriptional regulator
LSTLEPKARQLTAKIPKKIPPPSVLEKSVRAPQQARSQQTYERILDVVGKLVLKNAYENATVSEIVRLAKCSVGAFYGRFSDKDAAMFALYNSRCAALENRVLAILEQGRVHANPLAQTMSDFVDCIIDHTFSNAAFLHAERYLASAKTAAPFWARRKDMNTKFLNALYDLLKERSGEFTHDNPKTAALITLSIVGGLPRDAINTAPKLIDAPSKHVKDYKAEIIRVVLGYLGVG